MSSKKLIFPKIAHEAPVELVLHGRFIAGLKDAAKTVRRDFANHLEKQEANPPSTQQEATRARLIHDSFTARMMKLAKSIELQQRIFDDDLKEFMSQYFPSCKPGEGETFAIISGHVDIVKIPPVEVLDIPNEQ